MSDLLGVGGGGQQQGQQGQQQGQQGQQQGQQDQQQSQQQDQQQSQQQDQQQGQQQGGDLLNANQGDLLQQQQPQQKQAPEQYEDFKVPEGLDFGKDYLPEFKTVAKEMNLSQENAQKIVDGVSKMAKASQDAQAKRWEETQAGWRSSAEKDQEFGGANLKDNMAIANKALDKFGTSELNVLLKDFGLVNHPEVVRFAFRVGKAISEDTVHQSQRSPGGGGQGDVNQAASALYAATRKGA